MADVAIEAAADDEALLNPRAPVVDGEEVAKEELPGEPSWAAGAEAWRLGPEGFDVEDDDFFELFSLTTEAVAEACRVVDPLPE